MNERFTTDQIHEAIYSGVDRAYKAMRIPTEIKLGWDEWMMLPKPPWEPSVKECNPEYEIHIINEGSPLVYTLPISCMLCPGVAVTSRAPYSFPTT